MKNIFIVGLSRDIGGVETYIMNFIRSLDLNNYKIYYPRYGSVSYQEELDKVGCIALDLKYSRHQIFQYYFEWRKIFKLNKFDVLYYNTCELVTMDVLIFAKWAGVKTRIIHSHNTSNGRLLSTWQKLSEKWCKENVTEYATNLLACSIEAGKWMFGNNPFTVIRNGIDIEKFRFSKSERNFLRNKFKLDNTFVLGFVGRLEKQKNLLYLIDIFSKLKNIIPSSKLLLFGDGSMRKDIEDKVLSLGFEDCILLRGNQKNISKLYNVMDCFIMPSLYEGLPFALVEAQANGVPCIISDSISTEVNITEEIEFVSLSKTPQEWAEIIVRKHNKKEREEYADIVAKKGFDLNQNVARVKNIWS